MANQKYHNLGRFEQIDLRKIWTSESDEFTPWLADEENLNLLGDSIGLELELEAQEKNVGPFRADILCKDTSNDTWVLIENQLEKTDHIHLGQLMTYASGLKAVKIVWIAKRFTEEHRAALDWLNEITDERFNFFGIEVELWRIGDSKIAPKFNIVSKPNDWSKTVAAGASQVKANNLTDAKLLQRDFWAVFNEYVKENSAVIKPTKPLPQHWMNIAIGKSGMRLCAVASFWDSVEETSSSHEIRAEFIIEGNNSKNYFEKLEQEKTKIDSEVGEPLIWYNPTDAKVCKIYLRKSTKIDNKENWPEQHVWLLEKLTKLYNVFHDRVKRLTID